MEERQSCASQHNEAYNTAGSKKAMTQDVRVCAGQRGVVRAILALCGCYASLFIFFDVPALGELI